MNDSLSLRTPLPKLTSLRSVNFARGSLVRLIFLRVSISSCFSEYCLTFRTGEEPLLKESRRRFVLFPIQYPEVRVYRVVFILTLILNLDLANVQEGRGVLLDC